MQKVIHTMDQRITVFNDIVSQLTVSQIQEDLQVLLSDWHMLLSKLNESDIASYLTRYMLDWDSLYCLIEKNVLSKTYELIFFKICQECSNQDMEITKIVEESQNVTMQAGCRVNLKDAIESFKTIESFRTPVEKMNCIRNMIDILNKSAFDDENGGRVLLSSDELIPLILICVIKSNVLNLYSNFEFIKRFSFEMELENGESGYLLSTFELVLSYISDNCSDLLENSAFQLKLNGILSEGKLENFLEFYHEDFRPSFVNESLSYCCDFDGQCPFLISCKNENIPIMEFLLANEYSVNTRNNRGQTGLHVAALNKLNRSTVFLLENDVDVNILDADGNTALDLAIINLNFDIADTILQERPNLLDLLRKSPCFQLAITPPALTYLFQKEVSFNLCYNGQSPLTYYCQNGLVKLSMELLEKDLDVDVFAVDYYGKSFIHYLILHDYEKELLQLLSSRKISDVDKHRLLQCTDFELNTPLHTAVLMGNISMVKLLLQSGADCSARNAKDMRPQDLAADLELKATLFTFAKGNRGAFVGSHFRKDGQLFFSLHSYVNSNEMSTVHRTLEDFGFFHSQLLIEFPEAFIPEIRELVAGSKWLTENDNYQLSICTVMKRLESYISYLLEHPKFKQHELLNEFLKVSDIERDMIQARIQSKMDYVNDGILQNYSPYVSNMDELRHWERVREKLDEVYVSERSLAAISTKLQRSRKDFGVCLTHFGFHLEHPSICLFVRDKSSLYANYSIADLFVQLGNSELSLFSNYFNNQSSEVNGARNGIAYIHRAANEFESLQDHTEQLSKDFERLSSSLGGDVSEKSVSQLNFSYKTYLDATKRLELNACKFNYALESVEIELQHFKKMHFMRVEQVLDSHVVKNIQTLKSSIKILEEALNV
ncbi:hypothetical protein BC833DRAFT_571195 [Globomyces pollinis-pini]|nr:hypothetical protein BC833DRAFT_571195 [Globomyces pollinis-pini]